MATGYGYVPPGKGGDMVKPPTAQVMKDTNQVPEMFRQGGWAPYLMAKAYTDGLGPGNVTAKDVSGCYQFRGPCACGGALSTYNLPCGEDCACSFPCFMYVPTALCCVCFPLCERDGNSWVNRDKSRIKTGETLLVDQQMGTFACYAKKCCSSEFDQEPQCIGEKTCCGASDPVDPAQYK